MDLLSTDHCAFGVLSEKERNDLPSLITTLSSSVLRTKDTIRASKDIQSAVMIDSGIVDLIRCRAQLAELTNKRGRTLHPAIPFPDLATRPQ